LSDVARDKQFQMFWANMEVLKPELYAQAPVPVVVPKFKDRRPVYQEASEGMERCVSVAFDMTRINDTMLQLRDDLALTSRGVPWCRYESGKGNGYYDSGERVCIEFKHRRDFLHSISRCWYEVTWVAAASYLTRSEARDRFYKHSGEAYQLAEYRVDKDSAEVGGADNRERAKFWEIWHKSERRVVWVAKGVEDILDEDDPHLDLECFFPCPQPAYGTLQRGSLVPVPDVMQYKDQLEEVNMLTGKIHALSDALEVKGFYPAGGNEIADAVQQALKIKTPGEVLVPIKNWAAFGGTKEVIVWMPIDVVAQTITALIGVRKQVIDDIYQVMGLSDIMRGSTDPNETLGAQELKGQYGSARIRDKQHEMQRIARDLVAITSEIICEKFDDVTIIEMSQTQLPTQLMQQQKMRMLQQQLQQQQMALQNMQSSPQMAQLQQTQPDAASGATAQINQKMTDTQQQIEQIKAEPTIEQVLTFLKDYRAKMFVLDIETDSTIMPDEQAEKEAHSEFLGVLSGTLEKIVQMITVAPQTTKFCGEVLKFAVKPFRVGRSLDSAIDELIEQIEAMGAAGGQREDPTVTTSKTALQIEQIKTDRQAKRDQADVALKAAEIQKKDEQARLKIQSDHQLKMMELQQRNQDEAARAQQTNLKSMQAREAHQADMIGKAADMQLNQQKMDLARQAALARQGDMAQRTRERQAALQLRQNQPPSGRFGV